MSETREYGKQEFLDLLADQYDETTLEFAVPMINGWLARGDGAAVYRNADLGQHELGQAKIVSFGSATAQLEVETAYLPARLPDNLPRGAVNWRYQLEGIYRGEQL